MFKGLLSGFLTVWSLVSGCPFSDKNCNDCDSFRYKIRRIGQLPAEIRESSGLLKLDDLFLTHGDSGNEALLWGVKYPFTTDTVHGKIRLDNIENIDWEELAFNNSEKVFIGDFGNNNNQRKDLRIIKYDIESGQTELIQFTYGNQQAYPAKKLKGQNFDCEAMLWAGDRLYLFSKNKKNKYTFVYSIPDTSVQETLFPYDSLNLGGSSFITSADINPEKSEVVLLSYGKVLFMDSGFDRDGALILTPKSCKRFGRSGQAEAIVYIDNENLLLTNEKGKVFLLYRKYKSRERKITHRSPEEILK